MRNKLFRHRLTADAMILVLLLSFAIHFSIIGFSMLSRGSFSGTVYASPGVPVTGAIIIAFGPEGAGYATTDSLGHYLINEGLKTGNYSVSAFANGYLQEGVEDVSVTVGMETSGINFYLNLSGGISGKVTDAVSDTPLKDIVIMAYNPSNSSYGWTAITDINGDYHIITNLATGTYNVSAIYPQGYVMKEIGGIAVTAGAEITGIDLALERSGIISGMITASPSGDPLGNATVMATSDDGLYFGTTQSNATGHYRIPSGLGTGNYTVTAIYGMGFGQVSDVNVTAGEETSGVDIEVFGISPPPPSGIITGKVTDTEDNPIENALVSAQGLAGSGEDYTDENGEYVISSGLGTGTYTVFAQASGYVTQNQTGVSVTVGEVTPNVNFQLSKIPPAQSGRISGTVQGDENPIPEFQYPIVALLVATAVAVALTKLFKVKARIIRRTAKAI